MRRRHFGRLGLAGFEATRPGPALRRDAPARRLPPHADGGPPGAAARRAVRLARCDHSGGDAVLARRRPRAGRHTVLLVTHDVEEALYLSDRVLVLTLRPASVADRIETEAPRAADRAAAVTSPEFAELSSGRCAASGEAAR